MTKSEARAIYESAGRALRNLDGPEFWNVARDVMIDPKPGENLPSRLDCEQMLLRATATARDELTRIREMARAELGDRA